MIVTLIYKDDAEGRFIKDKLMDLQSELNYPVLEITNLSAIRGRFLKDANVLLHKYAATAPFVLLEGDKLVRAVYNESLKDVKNDFESAFRKTYLEVVNNEI